MKRLHEYSRSSRFRIRRLLRDARNQVPDASSSSESDEEVNRLPQPMRLNERPMVGNADTGPLHYVRHHEEIQDINAMGSRNLGSSEVSSHSDEDEELEYGIVPGRVEVEGQSSDASDESVEESVVSDVDDDNVGLDNNVDAVGEDLENQMDYGQEPEEDAGWNLDNDIHIYDLSPITLGESMLAILSFYLRHNLSLVALSDLLDLINLHCRQEGNRFPQSLHQFKKFFANVQFPLKRHYYCSICFASVPQANAMCQNHNEGNDFFIQIPVIPQLQALYQRPEFREKLNYKLNRTKVVNANYEDIYDGAIYRALSEGGQLLSNPSNISLMWYTDGVSIFKSSKVEIWPFYLIINELPYNDRTKVCNAILAALWFGKSKPAPATFLQPVREDLLRLRQGINVSFGNNPIVNRTVKGIVLSGTADIPAKALFLNFKAHNSKYGCAKCKIHSVSIRRGLNVYPYREDLQLRTEEESVLNAREAIQLNELNRNGIQPDVFGVKGPSILSTFVHKWVRSVAVDEMHCVFQGLVKSLLTLWFEPKFRESNYSLSNHRELVNTRLLRISPPCLVQRLTRNLNDLKYWKAHELKTFLFYYSLPVLSDLMMNLYANHHSLLVLGIYLLNQRSISGGEIELASLVLTEYVSQFEDLYGIENMTCNLHQLIHLPDVVRDFGPLWITSCFPFEDMNGKLKRLVKGTRYAELQICAGVSMLMKLAELRNHIPDDSRASAFVKGLFDDIRKMKTTNIGHRIAIVGKYVRVNILPPMIQEALDGSNVEGRNYYEFYRFLKYCHVFGSSHYERAVKKNSTCVKYKHDHQIHFGFIDRFLKVTICNCNHFCDCEAKYLAIIRECEMQLDFSAFEAHDLKFIHTLRGNGSFQAVELKNLMCLCFVVNISDRDVTYVVEPVNMIEVE